MGKSPLLKVPRQIQAEAAKELSDFVIGFVKLRETKSEQDACLGGSGTLVQIDDTYGILSAWHVLNPLRNADEIGLVLPTRREPFTHRLSLKREAVLFLKIANCRVQSRGPDLGLLILAPVDIGTLKARKSFYNLPRHREVVVDSPPTLHQGIWFLCGFVGELTSEGVPDRGYDVVMGFGGACGEVGARKEYRKGKFDYLELEVRYGGTDEPPQNLKGFSGGGVWQVLFTQTHQEAVEVKDLFLSGVAFYQSALAHGHRIVKCHSRRSIYLEAVQALRDASYDRDAEPTSEADEHLSMKHKKRSRCPGR